MASTIKVDTIQSTTSNVIFQNSVGTEYARFDATGVFQLANPSSFPAGNVASPSITASGDTNTGIFFSAADTIDFAEGGTATGQFDSSGNFKFNSGYGSVATAYGCRAWVNFNATGTIAIRASGNISSITDNGTSDYTINITTAMPDINYAITASASVYAGARTGAIVGINSKVVGGWDNFAPTTTACRITVSDDTSTNYDPTHVCVSIFR
jgi:hypothetical protein